MKALWCVTGGEYLLSESVEVLETLGDVTVVFSQAGEEVAAMYDLKGRIEKAASEVVYERALGKSSQITMRLSRYGLVVVAPCSANTVAKVVHGVADSAVSNVVSQALKAGLRVVVLPTDGRKSVTGRTVSGKDLKLRCRKVDLDNVKKLAKEVEVVYDAPGLRRALKA